MGNNIETLMNCLPYRLLQNGLELYHQLALKKQYTEILSTVRGAEEPEIREFARNMTDTGRLEVFYGDWVNKYKKQRYQILREDGYCYVFRSDRQGSRRKLYFKKSMRPGFSEWYYKGLVIEQDPESPHHYETEAIEKSIAGINGGGTVLDIGAAEGFFAMDLMDRVKKCYLFEPDREWLDALNKSFRNNMDKIEIVPRFVSDSASGDSISIDSFFGDHIPEDISVIKMDIEGFETAALQGMKKTLEKNPYAVLLVCAYHRAGDENAIRQMMEALKYDVIPRRGYMLYYTAPDFSAPYIRRGVLEIKKHV